MIKTFKVFFFLVLLTTLFVNRGYAQENDATSPASMTSVKYDLAYPGILPDNPLYILKKIRDRITIFLISDSRKKADFYLLQTDKGILATAMLVDKNKIDLALDTAFKTEHNYTLLTYELKKIPEKPNDAYFQKLKTAALKHQEALYQIIEKVPEDKQKGFIQVLDFSKTNLKTINDYQKEKPVDQ